MKTIQGSIVALVTPFTRDNRIDFLALGKLINFHLDNGTNAILINGTTGESPTVSLEEFDQISKFTVEAVNGKIPVIAGTGSNNTEQAIIRSQIAEYNGVDALLVVSPYYSRPTNKGLRLYFGEIADATRLPIIMYNVPGRTGSDMSIDLIMQIASHHDNIFGIKEASGNMEKIIALIEKRINGFKVFSGDDHLALGTVLLGGDGCISVVANQIPKEFNLMLKAARSKDVKTARKIHNRYSNLMELNFIESNPIPVKTALYQMGLIELEFRSPMCEIETNNKHTLIQELVKLELSNKSDVKEMVLG